MCPKNNQQRFTAVALNQWRFHPPGDLRPCLSQLRECAGLYRHRHECCQSPHNAQEGEPPQKGITQLHTGNAAKTENSRTTGCNKLKDAPGILKSILGQMKCSSPVYLG